MSNNYVVTPEAKEEIRNASKHIDYLIDSRLNTLGGDKEALLSTPELSTSIDFNPPGIIAQRELKRKYCGWGFSDVIFEFKDGRHWVILKGKNPS